MNELITVIINVYNGEKYIKRCIDSVINQTYKNIEILIINDGSTDKTLSIIKKYKDKRIRVISTKNLGLSMSRNVGLDNAKGEYLYFVDADDYIKNDTINYLYNLCVKYEVPFSTTDVIDVINDKYKIKNKKEKIVILSGMDLLKNILLSIGRNGTIWNKLFKKDLFNNLRFQDRIINDVLVMYKIALDLDKYVYSNISKYYYYRHKDSILGKRNLEHSIDYYKASIERYNYIYKIYPNLKENDYCILWSIVTLYSHNNSELNLFLSKEKAIELFKNKFSLKVLLSKLRLKDKIKIIVFRISPKLYINYYK